METTTCLSGGEAVVACAVVPFATNPAGEAMTVDAAAEPLRAPPLPPESTETVLCLTGST
jgi:hypothetical protein